MTQLAIHRQSGQGKEQDIVPNGNIQMLDSQDTHISLRTACAQSYPWRKAY